MLRRKPSEIRFSQDSISNQWKKETKEEGKPTRRNPSKDTFIGTTLDQLLLGEITVDEIPTITVKRKDGYIYTSDNRRLWVFQKLEELGKCKTIQIKFGKIKPWKFTTKNEGTSVRIRGGDPGGQVWKKIKEETVNSTSAETLDLSVLSLERSDTTIFDDETINVKDIGYFQTAPISTENDLGELLDFCLSENVFKYYWDLEVFKISNRYYTSDYKRLWLLKNLENFGKHPAVKLVVIESPTNQAETLSGFFADTLAFTLNSTVGGTTWKSLNILRNLPNMYVTEAEVRNIFFTRPTISDVYENISIDEILKECIDTLKIPRKPRVIEYRGKYYALDNEIMWLLKEAEKVRGPLIVCVEVKIDMDEFLFQGFASDFNKRNS